eukprot:1838389-Prymnesium_polylepis.1
MSEQEFISTLLAMKQTREREDRESREQEWREYTEQKARRLLAASWHADQRRASSRALARGQPDPSGAAPGSTLSPRHVAKRLDESHVARSHFTKAMTKKEHKLLEDQEHANAV